MDNPEKLTQSCMEPETLISCILLFQFAFVKLDFVGNKFKASFVTITVKCNVFPYLIIY
jgi:hypothetical protein